jgi:DNA mismatch repair protein MutL
MSSNIIILPDSIVNRIAAGEVVERPSSVVKELLENAIDADASLINVEIKGGGKECIIVNDNGCGMNHEDAVLSVRKHATSKIQKEEDLDSIKTLGFRGEALPSIASVSRFRLITKDAFSDTGTCISIEGDAFAVSETGCPAGTTVEVKNLFYNTPARLKFLKSDSAERRRIEDLIIKYAVFYNSIYFKLSMDGKIVFDFPPEQGIFPRISRALGNETVKELFPVKPLFFPFKIEGFTSTPVISRNSSDLMLFYINGRCVQDSVIRKAVINAYGAILPKGRYPVTVLLMEMDGKTVDVNVHPQKSEVRFSRSGEIYRFIYGSVENAVRNFSSLTEIPVSQPAQFHSHIGQFFPSTKYESFSFDFSVNQLSEKIDKSESFEKTEILSETVQEKYSSLQILGQAANSFIVAQGNKGLYIFDQHAVHERQNFNRLFSEFQKSGILKQALLIPIVFEILKQEKSIIEEHSDFFSRLGFEIEIFSGNSVVVKTVPAAKINNSIQRLVKDLMSLASDIHHEKAGLQIFEKAIATIACHSSVRAGDLLNAEEMKIMISGMDDSYFSQYCPHGRNAVFFMPFEEILKKFNR